MSSICNIFILNHFSTALTLPFLSALKSSLDRLYLGGLFNSEHQLQKKCRETGTHQEPNRDPGGKQMHLISPDPIFPSFQLLPQDQINFPQIYLSALASDPASCLSFPPQVFSAEEVRLGRTLLLMHLQPETEEELTPPGQNSDQ